MFRSSKEPLFDIEAVLEIAYNADQPPVHSCETTERQGIVSCYFEPVLQELARHKIQLGIRGSDGGYRMAWLGLPIAWSFWEQWRRAQGAFGSTGVEAACPASLAG